MYSFHRFKRLSEAGQIDELNRYGVALDATRDVATGEAVLFAYNDFYVELLVQRRTDEILELKCFKSMKKLESYLPQVDISDIQFLLSCG